MTNIKNIISKIAIAIAALMLTTCFLFPHPAFAAEPTTDLTMISDGYDVETDGQIFEIQIP